MGDGIRISVDGCPELVAALDGLPLYIRQQIEVPVLEEAAEMILAAIQSRAPKATGAMAAEIDARTTHVGTKPAVVIRPAYKRVRYTHIVEGGAKPHRVKRGRGWFMHPGFEGRKFFEGGTEATAEAAQQLVETKIEDAISAYWDSSGGGQ